MGSFIGHALPGSLFILLGLWWTYHVVLEYVESLKESKMPRKATRTSSQVGSWRKMPCRRLESFPMEPLFKLFSAILGIVCELWAVHFHLVDENNKFTHPNKFSHATMYSFFAFSGLVETLNHYKITRFSREAEYFLLAMAFAVEATLFAFHLDGRDKFDVRIHTLLYTVVYLTAFIVLLEACLPRFRRELFAARTVFVLTQGTWFWEIGQTIYGNGRWIDDEKSTAKELMVYTDVITFSIMWHLLFWLASMLFCCVVTGCLQRWGRFLQCCARSANNGEKSRGLTNGNFTTPVLITSSDDEEEVLLEKRFPENNNKTDLHDGNNTVEEDD